MKKTKLNYLTIIAGITLTALIFLLTYTVFTYFDISTHLKHRDTSLDDTSYAYHCAFISGSSSDELWDSIYQSAMETGASSNIYVENFGKNLYIDYSTDELIKMAIAAKVDAILVEPTGNYSTSYQINRAISNGIAVGTLYHDDLNSSRYNYTGLNNVSLGYDYGALAREYSDSDASSVMVLLDTTEKPSERRLFLSGIGEALSESYEDIKIDTLILDSSNSFDAEEKIRTFLKDSHSSTDIIICTNLLQTQYVSQAAIDLNYVGDFTIIGSFQNLQVLEALKSGVISASIVIDTEYLGRKAVENLVEYLEYGHSSDYTPVSTYTITSADADQILKGMTESEEGGSDET